MFVQCCINLLLCMYNLYIILTFWYWYYTFCAYPYIFIHTHVRAHVYELRPCIQCVREWNESSICVLYRLFGLLYCAVCLLYMCTQCTPVHARNILDNDIDGVRGEFAAKLSHSIRYCYIILYGWIVQIYIYEYIVAWKKEHCLPFAPLKVCYFLLLRYARGKIYGCSSMKTHDIIFLSSHLLPKR